MARPAVSEAATPDADLVPWSAEPVDVERLLPPFKSPSRQGSRTSGEQVVRAQYSRDISRC
ncbi:hypothetical protein HS048_22780 [Planomonospora sp. ID91781]|uniref:hypothetical protein n=1 Tax=Planomonospora sp. ID91781 TaxID=2738135 RepID=UPI0018C3E9CE|nr:hypothetical protein [Planomonospora sp. ID91781]MBG0823554.1 hypothetical protein [Planomonospora sp. ID91781]